MWLRFYFFVFLRYYKIRNKKWKVSDSWYPSVRAFITVQLSLYFLLMFIILLLRAFSILDFIDNPQFKVFIFSFCIFSVIALYFLFIRNGKCKKVYKEFEDSPINTKLNRSICWIIALGSILLCFITAIIVQ